MDMDLQNPADAFEARARSRRNMSDAERWMSVAAGALMAAYGASRRRPRGWVLAGFGALLVRRGLTGHCHTYDFFGVNTAGTGEDTRRVLGGPGGVIVDERITIKRPIGELYRFWRNLENLPRFINHLESVEVLTETLSRWRAKAPANAVIEWNAEIINEVPNQVIGWRSIEGSDLVSAGSVHFNDAGSGRDTQVRVRMQYSPPGGKAGAMIAKLMGRDPAREIRDDLRRLKHLVEAGESATASGAI